MNSSSEEHAQTENEQPALSIVVPVYNSEAYLDDCLGSIVESNFKDYELIVVDDGSKDNSATIASQYSKNIIQHPQNKGRNAARMSGFSAAKGSVLVNIDSDILIDPTLLDTLMDIIRNDNDSQAWSGMLGVPTHDSEFLSSVKNLKLHHLYSRVPGGIGCLYGGFFAVRSELAYKLQSQLTYADDTDIGQALLKMGVNVSLEKDLQVQHSKKYSLWQAIKDDFQMAYDWAQILLLHQLWLRLEGFHSRFRHFLRHVFPARFCLFLIREKGIFFTLLSIFVLMLSGITIIIGFSLGLMLTFFRFLKEKIFFKK